jgi:hypothetical protein
MYLCGRTCAKTRGRAIAPSLNLGLLLRAAGLSKYRTVQVRGLGLGL